MKDRVVYLDIIRILAILMVVLTHTPMPGLGTPGVVLSTISLFCVGSGLFFMVSGALLLPAGKEGMVSFYKRRFSKLIPPLLIWTIVYLLVSNFGKGITAGFLFRAVVSIPFSPQGAGILWFLYSMAGLYLLAPIVSPFLERATKKEVEILLVLWAITLCFPMLKQVATINTSVSGILYYFSGFAGYFVLGYYISKVQTSQYSWWIIVLLLLIPALVAALCRVMRVELDFYEVFWYQSIFKVSLCAGFFLLLKRCVHPEKISDKWRSRLAVLSNLSFGVYLIHFLLIRNVLWKWGGVQAYGGIAQIVLTFAIATILSFSLAWLISMLPFGDKIIGYKKKR